jgi:thiosulfate dehydrogenase
MPHPAWRSLLTPQPRTNMPFGVRYQDPVLSVQQAWDVAAYMISKPRPPAPPGAISDLP